MSTNCRDVLSVAYLILSSIILLSGLCVVAAGTSALLILATSHHDHLRHAPPVLKHGELRATRPISQYDAFTSTSPTSPKMKSRSTPPTIQDGAPKPKSSMSQSGTFKPGSTLLTSQYDALKLRSTPPTSLDGPSFKPTLLSKSQNGALTPNSTPPNSQYGAIKPRSTPSTLQNGALSRSRTAPSTEMATVPDVPTSTSFPSFQNDAEDSVLARYWPNLVDLDLGLRDVMKSAALWLILLGFCLVILGMAGIAGLLCQYRWLILYQGMILMAWAWVHLLLALVVCKYKGTMLSGLLLGLEGGMVKYYDGKPNSESRFSKTLDFVQARWQCCGLTSHEDFQNFAINWGVSSGNKTEADTLIKEEVVPRSCCRLQDSLTFPVSGDLGLQDPNCPRDPTPENSYVDVPCWNKTTDLLNANWAWLSASWLTIGAIFLMTSHVAWALV